MLAAVRRGAGAGVADLRGVRVEHQPAAEPFAAQPSGPNDCVEVAALGDHAAVRDSKDMA
ncbi:DUF397 domain-containing protein [Streptomyces sp. T028]|uniref:DUF397 domain-containing protein n=1 Tax=Streptomyces sp. T028 TaxID=3394379 RepID=UPI003A8550DE